MARTYRDRPTWARIRRPHQHHQQQRPQRLLFWDMQAQRTDWVDAVRYFRGLGPPRRRRIESLVVATTFVMLGLLTLLAAVEQFG